jgi:hypothetical protein
VSRRGDDLEYWETHSEAEYPRAGVIVPIADAISYYRRELHSHGLFADLRRTLAYEVVGCSSTSRQLLMKMPTYPVEKDDSRYVLRRCPGMRRHPQP